MSSSSHKSRNDEENSTSGFDSDRLADLVYDALLREKLQDDQDADLLMEATRFAVEEAATLQVDLDGDDYRRSEMATRGSLTLNDVESHPIHGIMQQVCHEMLGLDPEEATSMTSDILDDYYTFKAENEIPSEADTRQKRGILGECDMCERCMMLTEHHLIPRSTHSTLLQKGRFTKKEMLTRLTMLCRPCHSFVHRHISATKLALTYNTLEMLLARPDVYKWAQYASKLKERDPNWGLVRGLKNKR